MNIKYAYLADFPNFQPMVAQFYKDFWGYLYPERTLEDWCAVATLNKDKLPVVLIAFDADSQRLLGTVAIRQALKDVFPEEGLVELFGLYVAPESRKAGIGSGLIRYCEQQAILFCDKMVLFTYNTDQYYQKRGWRPYKNPELMYRGKKNFLFEKVLKHP